MSIDPVCGMEVDERSATAMYEYEGKTYYFCSPGCKAAFEKDPTKYISAGDQHGGPEHQKHGQ